MNNNYLIIAVVCFFLALSSCTPAENEYPGTEYMPDMGHSIAYEANHYDYYYYNTWGTEGEYYKMAQPRKPVNGTIARGFAGVVNTKSPAEKSTAMNKLSGQYNYNAISIPVNGNVPYYYEDSDDGRNLATAELIDNPYPITDAGLERGKELYDIFCGICHGKKGDGNGYLVAEENANAVYPAQPAILINDEFTAASNGRLYHAIMYGKNVMGGYADKISYEERWQVVHYIRSLQAKDRKLVYAEEGNSLNTVDVPAFRLPKNAMASKVKTTYMEDYDPGMSKGGGDHGHGGGHGDGHGGSHGDGSGHGDAGHGESHGGDHGETQDHHDGGEHQSDDGHDHGGH